MVGANAVQLEQRFTQLEEKNSKLEGTVHNYIRTATTVQMSSMKLEILEQDGFIVSSIALPLINKLQEVDPFVWNNPNDEQANSVGYLNYCATTLGTGLKNLKFGCNFAKSLLNCTVGNPPHHFNGNTDVAVSPASATLSVKSEIIMTIELKPLAKEPHKLTEDNLYQAIAQVIGANFHFSKGNCLPSPVGVLTDLKNEWALIWIGTEGEIIYSHTEYSEDDTVIPLKRCTAIHYINSHLKRCNDLLSPVQLGAKRNIEVLENKLDFAFGFPSGKLRLETRGVNDVGNVNMKDVYDVMSSDEIMDYQKNLILRKLENSSFFPLAAKGGHSDQE